MYWFTTYGKEIIAVGVPLIASILSYVFRPKVKLVYSVPHVWNFNTGVPWLGPDGKQLSPTTSVRTGSIIIRNDGRQTARNVEVVFSQAPACTNIWPMRHHSRPAGIDGRQVLMFETLGPGEQVGVEMLEMQNELPAIESVRSDEGPAATIALYPQVIRSRRRILVERALKLSGAFAWLYALLVIVQFVVLKTPFGR